MGQSLIPGCGWCEGDTHPNVRNVDVDPLALVTNYESFLSKTKRDKFTFPSFF